MAKKHVFVSYSHIDREEVSKLVGDLKKHGEAVWWDAMIPLGADWAREIRLAIRESYAVIICVSSSSEEHYRNKSGIFPELSNAIERLREFNPGQSFIFPVKLSPCELPFIEIDSTRTLDRLQHVEFFPLQERDQAVDRLVAGLRRAAEHP
jgi:hypothetical protein